MNFNIKNDLRNKIINNFTVLEIDYDKSIEKNKLYYICKCNCENKTIKSLRSDILISQKAISCGCLNKNNHFCAICGSNNKVCFSNKFNDYLCHKHYMQIYHTGKIKEKFMKDINDYILYDDYAEIILYNKEREEKARAIIDLEDVDKCKLYRWGLTSNIYVISINYPKVNIYYYIDIY